MKRGTIQEVRADWAMARVERPEGKFWIGMTESNGRWGTFQEWIESAFLSGWESGIAGEQRPILFVNPGERRGVDAFRAGHRAGCKVREAYEAAKAKKTAAAKAYAEAQEPENQAGA